MPEYATVCYVEREAFCAGILAARMADGRLHQAPVWSDIATFDGRPWRGLVDVVSAGYPCQPFSVAGRRRGAADPRHLWPHVARIIDEVAPAYVFLENVPGHVRLGLRDVRADLLRMGYSVHAGIFSAAQCGAPQIRKRLFVLAAHAERVQLRQQCGRSTSGARAAVAADHGGARDVADASGQQRGARHSIGCDLGVDQYAAAPGRHEGDGRPAASGTALADADGKGQSQSRGQQREKRRRAGNGGGAQRSGAAERAVGVPADGATIRLGEAWRDGWEHGEPRTAAGQPHRIDQLRALGNAVVPQAAALAFTTLAGEWAASLK